jgi:hypothetical protein
MNDLDNMGFTTDELVAQNPSDDTGVPAVMHGGVAAHVEYIDPDPDATPVAGNSHGYPSSMG